MSFFLALALALNLLEAPGYSSPLLQGPDLDHDGKPNDLHWSEDVNVIFGEGTGNWQNAWKEAAAELPMFTNPVSGTDRERVFEYSPPTKGVVYVTVDKDGVLRGRGSTMVYHYPDGEIISATITLPSECGVTQRKNVLVHELLHVLGLAHVDDTDNVMYPYVGPRQSMAPAQKQFVKSFRKKS